VSVTKCRVAAISTDHIDRDALDELELGHQRHVPGRDQRRTARLGWRSPIAWFVIPVVLFTVILLWPILRGRNRWLRSRGS